MPPKRRRLSGDEAIRIFQGEGFLIRRQTGSHVVLQREWEGRTWTVIVPRHAEVAHGTLASIIRQSGLPKSLFQSD